MPGTTVGLFGDLSARRELGKVSTQSDIHLHDFTHGGRHITLIVPDRYPEQLKCLSYAALGSDAAVVVVKAVDKGLGEQVLAIDAAGIEHGIIVLTNYVQPEQVAPLLKGTTLASWPVQAEADFAAVKDHIAKAPLRPSDGDLRIPVDHHFDVRGVGAVILGVVAAGTVRKNDTLHAFPDKVICPVRSIQVHDVDVHEAPAGDRVGIALRNTKADQLDRGMVLAPAEADLRVLTAGETASFTLTRSPYSKPLGKDGVVHVGFGMQFVPMRLLEDPPRPGLTGKVTGRLEKALVVAPGERGILWHVDAGQRVVGRLDIT